MKISTHNIDRRLGRFIRGLKKYNLTQKEIIEYKFKYAGGDSGCHHNYFIMCDITAPEKMEECVCGHSIIKNCYIHSEERDQTLVLGTCCIKRFIPKGKQGRTCSECGDPHRNRKVNKCNGCRQGSCDRCGKGIEYQYKVCWGCQ